MKSIVNNALSRRAFMMAAMAGGAAVTSGLKFTGRTAFATEEKVEVVNGFCDGCLYKKCGTKYTIKNGVLANVEGNPDATYNSGSLCTRGQAQIMSHYNPWRVKRPLKRTNPKKGLNEDPRWVEISWEEALSTTTKKIKEVMEKDPREFFEFSGFGTYASLYMRPFGTAVGTPNIIFSPGCFCSGHSASEILHGGFIEGADPNYNKFRIDIGRSQSTVGMADGETQAEANGRLTGQRVVKVDPKCSTYFSTSQWVPIKPQTELAFLLAMENVIIFENKKFDIDFVKKRTNGTYLIKSDGTYLRDPETNKPLIWDTKAKAAKTFDAGGIKDYALEGTYVVNGVTVRPAFQLIKNRISEYTPEWQEKITTVPAKTVRDLANELVKEAKIGKTITIDGYKFPLRPAAISTYKGLTNHQFGHLAYYTAMTINILIGAFDVPGGNLGYNNFKYQTTEDGHPRVYHLGPVLNKVKFPANAFHMENIMPLAHDTGYQYTNVAKDPAAYGFDYKPRVGLTVGGNLYSKGGSAEDISAGFAQLEFLAAICLTLDEHAHFADIVFPEASHFETIFCYYREFDRPGKLRYTKGPMGARKALVSPLYDGKHVDEIFIELADRLGILPKLNGMVKGMNGIAGEIPPMNKSIKTTFDAWIGGMYGPEWDFDKVAMKGQHAAEPLSERETYQYYHAPDDKIKLPIYNVFLQNAREELRDAFSSAGKTHPIGEDVLDEIMQPIPHWFTPYELTAQGEEFDLNMIGWRIPQMIHDVNNSTGNHLLQEVAMTDPFYGRAVINSATAATKGLRRDDKIFIENKHGVKIGPVPIHITEAIHPQAIGVAGGHARKAATMDPINNAGTVAWNRLCSISWKSIDPVSGAIEISPAVKITKA